MNFTGNTIIRIGLGLLFIWGGLEKFFVGYFGGVGLEKMASSLHSIGFSFLGETGTYYLAIFLAATELLAGILILINKKTAVASFYSAFVLVVAMITVYLPRADWMQSMIHIALICSFLGIGYDAYRINKKPL